MYFFYHFEHQKQSAISFLYVLEKADVATGDLQNWAAYIKSI